MFIRHPGRIAEEGYQPIDDRRYMACHPLERGGHIHPEPSHHLSVLIARDRPFPEIIGNKERYHKNDNVAIWSDDRFEIFDFRL